MTLLNSFLVSELYAKLSAKNMQELLFHQEGFLSWKVADVRAIDTCNAIYHNITGVCARLAPVGPAGVSTAGITGRYYPDKSILKHSMRFRLIARITI